MKNRTFPELILAVFEKAHEENVDLSVARSMVIWGPNTTDDERHLMWGDIPEQTYSAASLCQDRYVELCKAWQSGQNKDNFVDEVKKIMVGYEAELAAKDNPDRDVKWHR